MTLKPAPVFLKLIAATVLTLPLIMGSSTLSRADDSFEIIATEGAGWIKRADESVKATIEVGDKIKKGDTLEVRSNRYVEVATDSERKNIVHITGPSSVQFSGKGHILLDLKEGQLFSFLDNPKGHESFKVRTPTMVAASRGTHYQVNFKDSKSEAMTYKGLVNIRGRDSSGNELAESIDLAAGHKTSITDAGSNPLPPSPLSDKDSNAIKPILQSMTTNVDEMNRLRPLPAESKNLPSKETPQKKASSAKDDSTVGNKIIY